MQHIRRKQIAYKTLAACDYEKYRTFKHWGILNKNILQGYLLEFIILQYQNIFTSDSKNDLIGSM